jgi:hypothetical protein
VRRLARFLATLIVLLGLLPCEVREAAPGVGLLVSTCCAEDDEASDAGEDEDTAPDCCDSAACACAAVALAVAPALEDLRPFAYLNVDMPPHLDRPTWRAGPPPTPPPIA